MEQYTDKEGKKQVSTKYNPTRIRLAKDDEVDKAELTLSFVFGKDAWDDGRMKDEKKVDISAYFTTYDRATKSNIFLPLQLVLNCENLDLTNTKHKAYFDYYKNLFSAGRKEYYETQWVCQIVRGVEETEITMDDLSKDQKLQIELGITTLEEIQQRARGGSFGNRISEIRLVKPTNKFEGNANNLTDYEEDDFLQPIVEVETKEDLFNKDKIGDDEIDSLFGTSK
jgi:hypothetical protein